ncbi:unnamed protein product [Cylindrotheca closterium]|uniref:Fe2OG dioxygenase domain-containing protein n=1 Tax=Cylindrotheca closterium TaxID=2856 RepID=A0AAD2CNU1_9STRA|nr:unnamed protein product [Cylindrotheca closterium]
MGMEDGNAPPPKLFSDALHDDMQQTLLILEKRIANGPGSVTSFELDDLNDRTERIVKQMREYEEGQISESTIPEPIAAMEELTSVIEEPSVPSHEEVEYAPVIDQMRKKLEVEDDDQLRIAASNMDATKVSELLGAGFEMDEETTDAAFWSVVDAVDRAEQADQPLSADVARMLHHIFDADQIHLQKREKISMNITCKQPDDTQGMEGAARRMNYIFDDSSHKDLPLKDGRCCEGGACCDKCSRNIFPTFATDAESSLETFPEIATLSFNELETVSSSTILQFVRLVERVRRTIAHEYGLPLNTILPLQAYSRKYVAGTTQRGGGGGEGDFVTLHTDEATHSGYHYSCVIYLSTQGDDFEGGDFVFNDPAEEGDEPTEDEIVALQSMPIEEQMRRSGRKLTPFHPSRGAAVIFSSGWENMHEVEKITSGVRYAVPCFFTTCPVPEAAYEQMAQGKPQTDEEIADDWLHLLLAHRKESPMESVGRVKELLMKWNMLCSPLDQH